MHARVATDGTSGVDVRSRSERGVTRNARNLSANVSIAQVGAEALPVFPRTPHL